ncbi:hypothetical protein GRJ2_003481800 [Grus japonensis]|uniref:Uncharacterized protein n=2 Tax=Grus japonensis TaxID=30415 RepID=A0ABC9X4G6_GRUJA
MAPGGGRYFCTAGGGLEPFLAREVRARLGATEREEDLCPGTSEAHRQSFKLGSKGEGDNIRLACDMLWDDVSSMLQGQGAGEGPQRIAQRRAGHTAACSKPRGDEPGAPDATGTNRETLGEYIKRIPAAPANKSASSGTKLKCLYANARSMGNKQEELETCARLQGYDLIGITETWWDRSYDWSVGMEEYRLFRKDRQGRQGGGVTLYVNDQPDGVHGAPPGDG